MSKKAIVSACMLGECCRYDGKTKEVFGVRDSLDGYEIVPFCPEAPIFGTPRERISVVKIDNQHKIITDETNKDVTKPLRDEIESFIKKNPTADKIILKSKSPSCGYGTTPILNDKKEKIAFGNGIAVDMFIKHYGAKIIKDEKSC